MLGVLITLLFAVGAACLGHLLLRKLTPGCDPALRVGLSGLVGLGAIGSLTLFIGLMPGGLGIAGMSLVVVVALTSLAWVVRIGAYRISAKRPEGFPLLMLLAILLALIFALVGVLSPSDAIDWDALAYHLAVPKLWLAAGHITPISFIHHSNFPGAVDYLYIWGLLWGGESGAKAFTLAFHCFGIFAVFGFARQVYGEMSAWWATLAWATMPVVLWLSGTAYIDVQNGLYAGLGILFASLWLRDRRGEFAWLSGVMLGLAAGSKYTGLQTIFAVACVVLIALILSRSAGSWRSLLLMGGLAVCIASPWYVKNALWTGNPVYPFFYGVLGGDHWSPWQARVYTEEQQSFGVGAVHPPGRISPLRIGHAILGLAYQPGRYINPSPTTGGGFPIGAVGFVVVASLLIWLFSGRAGPLEGATLATVLLSLAMWFVLSEQSRYIIALGVPLSVLAGGAVARLRAGPVLAGAIAVQTVATFYVFKTQRFDAQIQVATGKVSRADYLAATVPFYEPAEFLNQEAKGGRVALYDEVFGFVLDVPYLWANPGHSNELGYASMKTGADLISALRGEGVTDVYVNLSIYPPSDPDYQRWLQAAGIGTAANPYSDEEWRRHEGDLNWKAKALLAEEIREGRLELVKAFGRRLIYRIAPA